MLTPHDFFNLESSPFQDIFVNVQFVWEPLSKLSEYIKNSIRPNVSQIRQGNVFVNKTFVLFQNEVIESDFVIEPQKKGILVHKNNEVLKGASVVYAGASLMDDDISIGENTVIEPGALIKGPTIIGNNTEVRQGAYIRGNALIGDNCVVGHATEIKSSIMLGDSKAGHFAYIGDSILGKVNLGAGTKLANLKIVKSGITLNIGEEKFETGLRKMGAILGDGVETGCNTVSAPGSILSKNVIAYPNATIRGYYSPDSIIKFRQTHKIEMRQ